MSWLGTKTEHPVFSTRILLSLRKASCQNHIVRMLDRGELAGDQDGTLQIGMYLFNYYTVIQLFMSQKLHVSNTLLLLAFRL